jgi:hypothetical protein
MGPVLLQEKLKIRIHGGDWICNYKEKLSFWMYLAKAYKTVKILQDSIYS